MALHSIRHVLIRKLDVDLWFPIGSAIGHCGKTPGLPVCTTSLFNLWLKLQCPPASLLFLEPIYELTSFTSDPDFWLNLLGNFSLAAAFLFLVPLGVLYSLRFQLRLAGRPSQHYQATASAAA